MKSFYGLEIEFEAPSRENISDAGVYSGTHIERNPDSAFLNITAHDLRDAWEVAVHEIEEVRQGIGMRLLNVQKGSGNFHNAARPLLGKR